MTRGGEVYTGTNVENASFGVTICAEQGAVAAAVAAGRREFVAIAVAGPDEDRPCMPCGRCRQMLSEFAPDLMVVVAAGAGGSHHHSLRQLLPHAFDLEDVAGRSAP